MSDLQPTVTSGRKFSAIWIVPVVAVLAGVWMVIYTWMNEGPSVTVSFENASGLEAGKTKVKILDVDVGVLEEIQLNEDLKGITATLKLDPKTRPLLRDDTLFWVVRARVGAGGVSGLSTLVSGAYIEFEPGTGKPDQRTFEGLDAPPLTQAGAPGLKLELYSDTATSVGTGDAVLYKGYEVGRIESTRFDVERQNVTYDLFIDAPFHTLVHSSTRFWNSSGISLDASATGVELHIGSMQTLLTGGVAFGDPPGLPTGDPVEPGTTFKLFRAYRDILDNPYKNRTYYVARFKQSLAGLAPGAPVSFRGIQIGAVERIMLGDAAEEPFSPGRSIPVLLYVEPGRVELPDTKASVDRLEAFVPVGIQNGLRASLATGNLLTGKQLIEIDYYADVPKEELGTFEGYPVIPSVETGIGRLEQQVSALLTKFNALPLETTVKDADQALKRVDTTLAELSRTLVSVNTILESNAAQSLPVEVNAAIIELRSVLDGLSQDSPFYQNLDASMSKLNRTLQNLTELTRQLSEQPNSVLFPAKSEADVIPEARR